MFNVTGGEIVIILLLGLIVLGPERLPEAMRKAGKTWGELRKMSSSFQDEVRKGFDEPVAEIKKTTTTMRTAASFATAPVKTVQKEVTKALTGTGTTPATPKPAAAVSTAAAEPAADGANAAAEPSAAGTATETTETVQVTEVVEVTDVTGVTEGVQVTDVVEVVETVEVVEVSASTEGTTASGTEPHPS